MFEWLLEKIKKRKNYCVMCQETNVEIGYKCEHGHVTCKSCVEAGITKCYHHFCDGKQLIEFEPEKKAPTTRLIEELQEEAERLRRQLERERERSRRPVVQPYTPPPAYYYRTGTADATDVTFVTPGGTTASVYADSSTATWTGSW